MIDAELENMTVEQLAYWFWRQRGSPEGSPETDWFRAQNERQIERRTEWPSLYALGIERQTR